MTGHNLAPVKFQCSKLQTSNKTCWRSQHGDFFHCKFVPGCLLQKRLATLDGRFSSKWRQQLFTIHDSVSHYNKWEWVALRLMNAVCRTWLSSSCTNTLSFRDRWCFALHESTGSLTPVPNQDWFRCTILWSSLSMIWEFGFTWAYHRAMACRCWSRVP